jgi:hypothetical protein
MEIMSAPSFRLLKLCCLACSTSLAGGSALFAGELVLQKVPPLTAEQAPAYPENLARHHGGAKIEAASEATADGTSAAAALLCDDPTTGYALSSGSKTLLITLSKIESINHISFLNEGVKGEVSIAISNSKMPIDSASWQVVSQQELNGSTVHAKIGPGEAKYVKLTFNVIEPGRIAGLGVYSTASVAAFTAPRARQQNVKSPGTFGLVSYNLTDVHTTSRALYVSSGNDIWAANNMIDDQATTTYQFAAGDSEPTAIIDLGKVTSLRRITALYTPRPGKVSFYVLESLPGHQPGAPKSLKLDEAALADLKAVGSVTDGTGRAAIDFPETTGRYILVRWSGASESATPFSVAEIAAFGGSGKLIAANTSAARRNQVESDGKTMVDAKDMGAKDFSKEEAPPEEGPPPPIAPPPPFVFIPEINVVSP